MSADTLPEVDIYTDGACRGNPGPGGWAAVLLYKGHKREISGGEAETTNQRMEIQAAIEGLRALKRPARVRLHSDSAYLVNAFRQGWIRRWRANGWVTAAKKPVSNKELWQELLRVMAPHRVEWVKVEGHADDEWNNRADALARAAVPAQPAVSDGKHESGGSPPERTGKRGAKSDYDAP